MASAAALYTGIGVHAVFAAVFLVTYVMAARHSRTGSIAASACVVAIITATVNWLQLGLLTDAVRFFTLAWGGFSFSLFLMGQSLGTLLAHPTIRRAWLGYVLALVGVLGAAGIHATQAALLPIVVAAFVLYALFLLVLVRERDDTSGARGWATALVVIFVAGTLTYIGAYVFSYPVMTRALRDVDGWLYLLGNVVTKIAVPIGEMWHVSTSDAAGSGYDSLAHVEMDADTAPYRLRRDASASKRA